MCNHHLLDDLVREALKRIGHPYPEDVIDKVALTIEGDAELHRRYRLSLCGGADLGRAVRTQSGLQSTDRTGKATSTLIKTFTILRTGPAPSKPAGA